MYNNILSVSIAMHGETSNNIDVDVCSCTCTIPEANNRIWYPIQYITIIFNNLDYLFNWKSISVISAFYDIDIV